MLYKVKMYNNSNDLGSTYEGTGITFENVTTEGVIEIVRFALEYGKAVSAVVMPGLSCDKDGCDI